MTWQERGATRTARLPAIVQRFRDELRVYQLVLRDPRTPKVAKWLLGAAVVYAFSPIDLIPDAIPVIGHFDDVILVPLLVILALKLIPPDVIRDCRARAGAPVGLRVGASFSRIEP